VRWCADGDFLRHFCVLYVSEPRAALMRNFVGLYLRNQAYIDNLKKKLVKQQYLFHMFSRYGELLPTNG